MTKVKHDFLAKNFSRPTLSNRVFFRIFAFYIVFDDFF